MQERGAEERKPTPQELNRTLRAVFDHLPSYRKPRDVDVSNPKWNVRKIHIPPHLLDQLNPGMVSALKTLIRRQVAQSVGLMVGNMDDQEQRQRGEYGPLFMKQADSALAPSLATSSCNAAARENLEYDFNHGIDKDVPESSQSYWITDSGVEDSGGPFDESRVMEVETVGFNRLRDSYLDALWRSSVREGGGDTRRIYDSNKRKESSHKAYGSR